MSRGVKLFIVGLILSCIGLLTPAGILSFAAFFFLIGGPMALVGFLMIRKSLKLSRFIYDHETGACHGCGATGKCGRCRGT